MNTSPLSPALQARCGEALDITRAARTLRELGMHREAALIERHFETLRWYRARIGEVSV
tara:strand:+ start:796 stop:972 length:177 start_codon:yes stop_codon:yes gene_type:complete